MFARYFKEPKKKIMVWGCFSWKGVGAFHEIKRDINKISSNINPSNEAFFPTTSRRYSNYIFQHDNDPKHTAHIVKNYLRNQQIEMLEWPPQSPDLNPVEYLWAELNRKLNKRTCKKKRKNGFSV